MINSSSRIYFLRTEFYINFFKTLARKYPEKQLLKGDLQKHFFEKFYKILKKISWTQFYKEMVCLKWRLGNFEKHFGTVILQELTAYLRATAQITSY